MCIVIRKEMIVLIDNKLDLVLLIRNLWSSRISLTLFEEVCILIIVIFTFKQKTIFLSEKANIWSNTTGIRSLRYYLSKPNPIFQVLSREFQRELLRDVFHSERNAGFSYYKWRHESENHFPCFWGVVCKLYQCFI